jgi:hypothetical protein
MILIRSERASVRSSILIGSKDQIIPPQTNRGG